MCPILGDLLGIRSLLYLAGKKTTLDFGRCVLSLFQILNLVAVNCTDHCDIKKLEATILEHVKNEELFPEVVRVLPPVYRQVEAAIVDIAQSEEMADHGEWSITPTTPSWQDLLSCG